MSAENEEQFSLEQHVETTHEAPQRSRISYTREFLLSLRELDICKKLPNDFDKSILSEFGDVSSSVPERPRVPGSLSSQNFRRGEYGSSPPTRGDSNYSRGVQGRWDSRSSGSNDRDGDSQSDKDSDSGKRFGNQPRRPWQNPEHDGLLGSGAFPRPSGHATGAGAPKVRGDGQYQLSRSNEPYHPPRPYKAVSHSRRDATDTFDDETFGSSELSSQDREEEERKRRASFELFRKENLKSFQEKKQFPDNHIEHSDPDIAALLRDSEDKKFCNEDSGPDDLVPPASQNDPTKCFVPAQAPASRPRVPPGFRSSIPEKNLVTKSLAPYPVSEIGNIELESKINHAKSNLAGEGASDNQVVKDSTTCTDSNEQQYEIKAVHIPFKDVGKKVTQSSDLEGSDNLAGVLHPSYKASKQSEAYEPRKGYGVADFDDEEMSGHQAMGSSGQKRSASILDKLFGGSITVNSGGSSGFPENNDVKADDTASNIPYQSSKFTHWFGEEKKPGEDLSSGKPKDLLSLIVSGEKSKPQASEESDEKNLKHIPPIFPFKSNEPVDRFIPSTATSGTVGIHDPLYHRKSQDATPGVLTCEDLEQSMLSEINDNSSFVKQPELAWDVSDAKTVQPKAEVDNLASQHILSLLQKGTSMKDPAPFPDLGVQSSASLHVHEVGSINTVNNSSQLGAEVHNPDNNLTLETFFGTSFMKELQSVQAPVSVQRGSGTTRTEFSGPHGFPFPLSDTGFRPSGVSGYESSKTTLEDKVLTSNIMQQTKSNKTENHLLGFDVRRNEVGSKHTGITGFQNNTDGAVEIQLPEEESLITVSDSMKPPNSMFMHVGGGAPKGEPVSSSTASLDIVDKLAALNAALKDERSMVSVPDGPSFPRGPYNSLEPEIPYQNIRGLPSSPPFPHMQQMNHGRPMIQTLDSHLNRMNPQMKFAGPESMIHHEPPHHPFPGNVFRPPFDHSAGGPTRFDLPAHNHMLQHMHVPGQFLPPHLLQGHPRGAPLPPHPINHMAGYISEPDPMQGFPLSHRQPSYGGLGMPMPAPGIGGSNHPDALGKLIEMEMRANSKQMHPVGPGAYGHEVDMGFRYR